MVKYIYIQNLNVDIGVHMLINYHNIYLKIQLYIYLMNHISILVVTSAYGGKLYVEYVKSILKLEKLCQERNIIINYELYYDVSLIPAARNILFNKLLNEYNYSHILNIDADIEYDPEDIITMIEFNKPVVGGLYYKKNMNKEKEPELKLLDDKNDLILLEVEYTGLGLFLVKREVLEKIRNNYPNEIYHNNIFKFFDTDIINKEYISEDKYFCYRWRKLNGKIYVYTKCKIKHYGINFFSFVL